MLFFCLHLEEHHTQTMANQRGRNVLPEGFKNILCGFLSMPAYDDFPILYLKIVCRGIQMSLNFFKHGRGNLIQKKWQTRTGSRVEVATSEVTGCELRLTRARSIESQGQRGGNQGPMTSEDILKWSSKYDDNDDKGTANTRCTDVI